MQVNAVEAIRQNTHVVLLAPTGTGKTLSFLLPLLEQVSQEDELPQSLILSPTRELATQTYNVLCKMNTGLRVSCVHGGRPAMEEHRQMASSRPQVIIGTPGRILDHIGKGNFSTSHIRRLVIDEFDKMLELKFQDELNDIIRQLPCISGCVLVSATDAADIRHFPPFERQHPVTLNYLGHDETSLPDSIRHYFVHSPLKDKLDTLSQLLRTFNGEPAVVFVNFREAVERVGAFLKGQGFTCALFHGGLEQEERDRALYLFMGSAANVLVSTDLSARGLDMRTLRHVVHYHLPLRQEDYLHRCGRTGRWEDEGEAFLILGPDESLPDYPHVTFTELQLQPPFPAPRRPEWVTLYIGKGKRDKISRGDVVGFLCKQGGAKADDIGRIDVKERYTYVSVRRHCSRQIMLQCANEKIKKQRTRIEEVGERA